MPFNIPWSVLVKVIVSVPAIYLIASYSYLAWWHKEIFLLNSLIHENGRLTLLGSLFYFDHFVALVPMITMFSLCAAGGICLAGRAPSDTDPSRTASVAIMLLMGAALLVLLAFVMSIWTVGWQRTLDYALQRIERDGIISKGGNWNQLQLSNIPIAFGTIGLSAAFTMSVGEFQRERSITLIAGGVSCIFFAVALCIGITALNWNGWTSFLNPRWLGHSIREIATYPFTGIPIALISVLLVENYLSGLKTWVLDFRLLSVILICMGFTLAVGELILLKNEDVLAYAQRPSFAPNGLSIPYLLSSHVFEHFLDFVLIGPLTGGIYALLRLITLK